MAKKAGASQLQAELNTDEDLENFILKSGLCLIDIYSEWCGQCLGLVSALRKIKLEVAGDSLNLAVAKAEGISHFKRFIRKSEPTWMFIVNQKAVNIYFGSDQPALTKLVIEELKSLGKVRKTYALNELQAIEIEKHRAEDEARAEKEAKEAQQKAESRHNYLTYVTDTIIDNLPDCAVTIFGSHIPKDAVKKVLELAESLHIHNKDRRYTTITKQDFATINFDCRNPLPEDVQELFEEEEALVCYWKLPDSNFKVLQTYANELTKPRTVQDENGETIKLKPLLKSATVKVQYLLESDEVYEEPPEPEPDPDDIEPPPSPEVVHVTVSHEADQEFVDTEEGGEEEEEVEQPVDQPPPPPPLELDLDLGLDLFSQEEENGEEEEEGYLRYGIKYVRVPAIWVPANQRAHAALIYVLFHSQTTPFLPPDPVPDPPHVIMAFDSFRRKQLNEIVERNQDKILYSGFFTSDDATEAEFLARSSEMYELVTKSPDDKYVLRVNKVTSHMMLSLALYNPSYVSPSCEIGAQEAKIFFPDTYKTASAEALEIVEETKRLKKEKKVHKVLESKDAETEPDIDDLEGQTEEGEEEHFGETTEFGEDMEIMDAPPVDSEARKKEASEGIVHEPEYDYDHQEEGHHYEGDGDGETGERADHDIGDEKEDKGDGDREGRGFEDEKSQTEIGKSDTDLHKPDEDKPKTDEPKPEEDKPKAEEPKPETTPEAS